MLGELCLRKARLSFSCIGNLFSGRIDRRERSRKLKRRRRADSLAGKISETDDLPTCPYRGLSHTARYDDDEGWLFRRSKF